MDPRGLGLSNERDRAYQKNNSLDYNTSGKSVVVR